MISEENSRLIPRPPSNLRSCPTDCRYCTASMLRIGGNARFPVRSSLLQLYRISRGRSDERACTASCADRTRTGQDRSGAIGAEEFCAVGTDTYQGVVNHGQAPSALRTALESGMCQPTQSLHAPHTHISTHTHTIDFFSSWSRAWQLRSQ